MAQTSYLYFFHILLKNKNALKTITYKTMQVSKLVIHEVIKESSSKTASVYTSNYLLPIEVSKTVRLAELLNNSFGKDKIYNALFKTDDEYIFPSEFKIYIESEKSNDNYIQFVTKITNHLKTEIEKAYFAKGGYLIHAEYTVNSNNYIASFLVRDIEGIVLNKESGHFAVNEIKYINVKNLAMACRININKYTSQNGKYIAFIKGDNQEKISDYFTDWVAIFQPESNADYTTKLYEIVNNISLPLNPESGVSITRDEFRKKVVDLISANNYVVDFHMISNALYYNTNTISEYAEKNDIELDYEFRADKRILKKFYNVTISKDNITLKFVKGDISIKIKASEENPNQIIIESESFAKEFKKQIKD